MLLAMAEVVLQRENNFVYYVMLQNWLVERNSADKGKGKEVSAVSDAPTPASRSG